MEMEKIMKMNSTRPTLYKIGDIERKGNVITAHLVDIACNNYYGDDWNDIPYEHNADMVYEQFVKGTAVIYVHPNFTILEAGDDWAYMGNSPYCKDDFKNNVLPFLFIGKFNSWNFSFNDAKEQYENGEEIMAISFNDLLMPGEYLLSVDGELKQL